MTQSTAAPAPATAEPSVAKRTPRWRRILVALLVIVGCVLAPLSVMGVWMKNTLLDTDQYVSTVGPLVDNPDVQQALATRITNALVQGTNVDQQIADALPPRVSFAAPAVADALERVVHTTALRLVESDQFESLWDTLNRRAHEQIVALLKGESRRGNITTNNGQVAVNLGPFLGKVQAALEKRGIDVFDAQSVSASKRQIVLVDSQTLKSAQGATDLLQKLAYILPFLTLLAFVVAIVLSGDRRRTILHAALGIALAMALLLVIFNVGRRFYLDALPASVNRAAAGAVYDRILSFLRLSLRTGFVVAVLVAIAAWISGPGRAATRIRTSTVGAVRGHETGEAPSNVAAFVARHRVALRVVVVGIGLAILAALDAPTPVAAIVIAIFVLVGLLLVEFFARGVPLAKADALGRT
jgi:hypothetical protein